MLPRQMLRGLVASMPVADVLEWMERRVRSGVALFERGALNRRLVVREGVVVRMSSSHPAEHLGRVLVGSGYLSEDQLQGALRPGQSLGKTLVERGLVAEDDLRSVLELKILEGCFELLSWDDGSFVVEPGAQPAAGGVPVAVPLGRILAEGKGRAALWRVYHGRIPSEDARFRPGKNADPADELVADLARGLTVRELMLERRWLPFTTYRRLAELAQRGEVELVGASTSTTAARTALLAQRLLGRAVVPRLAGPADEMLAHELSAAERALLGRIDGRWDAAYLVRTAPGGELEALAALDALATRGLVVLEAEPA
jgi:hypothetical protein